MISAEDSALLVYTDGSCLPHPRRGGYGIRIIFPVFYSKEDEILDIDSPSYQNATNNQMELFAVIQALKHVESSVNFHKISRVIVCTDSQYVSENYSHALFNWSKSKWFLKNGAPVQNADLWKELVKVSSRIKCRVEIKWVKGHAKNSDNNAVDKIAKHSAKSKIKRIFRPITVRRKLSPNKVNPGCIESVGQRISIRIITDEFLPIQKLFKYKIEVISKRSKYYNCVDFLYSKHLLKAGHSYVVSLKTNKNLLTISKILEEILHQEEKINNLLITSS